MTGLKEQFYSAPVKVQDGVLFIILEGAVYLVMSFVDLYHGHDVAKLGPGISFALELMLITALVLCGLGILYGMKAGWIGSVIMSIFLIVIGALFMLDVIPLTLTLSGLFYFVFGVFSFIELMRHSFRKYCGITKE
jgi:hypothetical protein